jgi:putative intracellular protease/amidase
MKPFHRLASLFANRASRRRMQRVTLNTESMEERLVMSADPLPVLMVIADQRDFYYQEYGDTRDSLEALGVPVQVAATTLSPSAPHAGTGEGLDGGIVVPDLTLADVNPDDYSAILFVGGWGSSMYQYAFTGDYQDDHYDGDPATKQLVNNLIGEFQNQDKLVTAICHGVTILAWARVDGASPLQGRQVSVPFIGSPAVYFKSDWYGNYELGQYEQVVANGAIANTVSMQYGDPNTVTDDVVRDGNIITAEHYGAAASFGTVVGMAVLDAAEDDLPDLVVNHAPIADDMVFQIPENSAAGTVVGVVPATDSDLGQTLTYEITFGNAGGAFAVDSATGQITVANAALLDFETTQQFQMVVLVTDNGARALNDMALITIDLHNVAESLTSGVHQAGSDVIVQGTSGPDTIYLWSGARASDVMVWMNGVFYGTRSMKDAARLTVQGADGNDRIFATDLRRPAEIFGGDGHDLMTGSSADDLLEGGSGFDRISGLNGADQIFGGDQSDYLFGGDGDDILVGGGGDDYLEGLTGRDFLIGGDGRDIIKAGSGDDLLIGGRTSWDSNRAALMSLHSVWTGAGTASTRASQLATGFAQSSWRLNSETVLDDNSSDVLVGGSGADLLYAALSDTQYSDLDDLFAAW